MKSNLRQHYITEKDVQDLGIRLGSWIHGLNGHMTVKELYQEGERFLEIDPPVAMDYKWKATYHAAIVCGYEEKRLGR